VFVLVICVGIAAWAFGKTQGEGSSPRGAGPGPSPGPGGSNTSGAGTAPQPGPGAAPQPGPSHAGGSTHVPPNPSAGAPPPPRSSWQRPNPQTTGASSNSKNSWEKAREETRKKEEERKRAEEIKKRREEIEKERQRRREEIENERQKQRERDVKEREERERKEKAEKAEQERKERDAAAAAIQAKEKEREREREREKEKQKEKERDNSSQKSAPRKPHTVPYPTARTETEDDAYSFRPYDRPKRPAAKAGSTASTYSESSYAASQTTARTTPPPSHRGPYTTKDPDKIIIKAVYSFNNAFQRTPVAQLISGQGNVSDGLILRITTEGLFIDDDVRGVPQREWDVKAWTMKSAEVWCPNFLEASTSLPSGNTASPFLSPPGVSGTASRRSFQDEQSQKNLRRLFTACTLHCKLACRPEWRASYLSTSSTPSSLSSRGYASSNTTSTAETNSSTVTDDTLKQSGELSGLHVLRASIRDQEGKKYVFILSQTEGWKVAVGLQRLRRGTQVRALGVSGMPLNETKAMIENLGWG
jgi:hypothetical protein